MPAVTVNLNAEEMRRLRRNASLHGATRSGYIRSILAARIETGDDLLRLLAKPLAKNVRKKRVAR